MLKSKYYQNLLYDGHRYDYQGYNDYDLWILYTEIDPSKPVKLSEDESFNGFINIVFVNGIYYGVNDFENKDNWTIIDEKDIVEVAKTQRQHFEKIVFQQDAYFGVPDSEGYDDLIRIDQNKIVKLSKYDPAVSVLASILSAPLVVVALWLSLELEDDW